MSDNYEIALINTLAEQRKRIEIYLGWFKSDNSNDPDFINFINTKDTKEKKRNYCETYLRLLESGNDPTYIAVINASKKNRWDKVVDMWQLLVDALHSNKKAVSFCKANNAESAFGRYCSVSGV